MVVSLRGGRPVARGGEVNVALVNVSDEGVVVELRLAGVVETSIEGVDLLAQILVSVKATVESYVESIVEADPQCAGYFPRLVEMHQQNHKTTVMGEKEGAG